MRSGIKKFKSKKLESKLRASRALARQICRWQSFRPDEARSYFLCGIALGVLRCFCADARAGIRKTSGRRSSRSAGKKNRRTKREDRCALSGNPKAGTANFTH